MIAGIGARIKEARLALNWTQDELAKRIGVTKGAVANYENNVSHPKEPIIFALIDALNVDANFLFQDCVTKNAPTVSAEAMKVAKEYDELPDWGQHMVRTVIADISDGVAAMEAEPVEYEPDIAPATRTVPLLQPFAAGIAEPEHGLKDERYEVPADSPADFAIRINGTSMEPYLHDHTVALGILRQPRSGEVGAFQLAGEYLVKQVVYNSFGPGYVFLLSANRAEEDKDVTLTLEQAEALNLSYVGTILTDRKIPLPKV